MKRTFLLTCCAAFLAMVLVPAILPVSAEIIPTLTPPPIVPGEPSPSPSPSTSPTPTPSPSPTPTQEPQEPTPASSSPPPEPPSQLPPPPPSSLSVSKPPLLLIPEIPRTPARTTARLLEIIAPLTDRGFPLERAMVLTSPPFPVAGYSSFSDDFMFPRYSPVPHLHAGTDIFADFGTPVVASGPGVIAAMANTLIGGTAMWVAGDDGHSFYYAHLISFAEGLQPGSRVELGTVLGYVGNTGNAFTTSPHLHFEVHPPISDGRGRILVSGVAVNPEGIGQTKTPAANPKLYLDRWLTDAELRAQTFVGQMVQRLNAVSRQIHFSRRVDDLLPAGALARPGDLLSLSVLDPLLGHLGLAHQTLIDSGLPGFRGSVAERSARQQRAAAVRLMLEGADVILANLAGSFR